jgi:hypothetical protein
VVAKKINPVCLNFVLLFCGIWCVYAHFSFIANKGAWMNKVISITYRSFHDLSSFCVLISVSLQKGNVRL